MMVTTVFKFYGTNIPVRYTAFTIANKDGNIIGTVTSNKDGAVAVSDIESIVFVNTDTLNYHSPLVTPTNNMVLYVSGSFCLKYSIKYSVYISVTNTSESIEDLYCYNTPLALPTGFIDSQVLPYRI